MTTPSNLNVQHNRVGIFYAKETHVEVLPGEWLRDPKQSSAPLPDIVNEFIEKYNVKVVQVSAPETTLLEAPNSKTRVYRSAVSVVYLPDMLISDNAIPRSPEELSFDGQIKFDNVPENLREIVTKAISENADPPPKDSRRPPKSTGSRNVVGVAKQQQAARSEPANDATRPAALPGDFVKSNRRPGYSRRIPGRL